MKEVVDKTLGSWTRPKNDDFTCRYDDSQNQEMFKFMTFTPEYLTQGSCVAGNTQNCATFASMDVAQESRLGTLTNLNELQRESTNDKAMGIMTTPDFSSGQLIDTRLIDTMATLESKFSHNTRLDIPPTSILDQRHLDEASRFPQQHPDLFPRGDVRVSSRVSRRNDFAEKCKRT